MGQRNRAPLALLALVVLLLAGARPAAAQETISERLIRESPRYPGQEALAVRVFEATALVAGASGRFQFGVRRFAGAAAAAAALETAVQAALTLPELAGLAEAEGPPLGDERQTRAVAGRVTLEGTTFDLAYLFILDGALLHTWSGAALSGTPLTELSAIAAGFFGAAATPEAATPAATAVAATPVAESTGDGLDLLLATLPTLADLPPGYVLESEGAALVSELSATPAV